MGRGSLGRVLLLQLSSHLVPLLLQESSHLVPLLLQESSLHFLSFLKYTIGLAQVLLFVPLYNNLLVYLAIEEHKLLFIFPFSDPLFLVITSWCSLQHSVVTINI